MKRKKSVKQAEMIKAIYEYDKCIGNTKSISEYSKMFSTHISNDLLRKYFDGELSVEKMYDYHWGRNVVLSGAPAQELFDKYEEVFSIMNKLVDIPEYNISFEIAVSKKKIFIELPDGSQRGLHKEINIKVSIPL